jgi:hypothetical protein
MILSGLIGFERTSLLQGIHCIAIETEGSRPVAKDFTGELFLAL